MKKLKVFDEKTANEMSIIERAKAETPPFFKKLRTIGIVAGVVGGALASAPIALPAGIIALSGYLITAGAVITAVSSITVDSEKSSEK
jgi:ABC-type transport system involved in cytochrome bd biosynthesis fused ATPase/permease subunit